MPHESTKEALEVKRANYEQELTWHTFLLDSYTGAGGYQGKVKQDDAGFWGIAAQTYARFATLIKSEGEQLESYLDRFPSEDHVKYARRRDVAHYLNYVEPTTAIKVGYLVRKPHKRNNVPPKLQEWIERSGYDKDFRRRALVTAVLGWFPMLIDMPATRSDALTMAQAIEDGPLDPYVVLSMPCHLLEYELDDRGAFIWAKMGVTFTRKPAWDADAVEVVRYTIWTKNDWTVYEVVGEEVGAPRTGVHPFKCVPVVSWRADTSVEDSVKAKSVNANIALECRRLFNLISEMDEHIRSNVFAQLIWPGSPPAANEAGGAGGATTGMVISDQAKNVPFYLAPPATVATTLEKRIESTIIEIFRIAGVEYAKASGVHSSAQSKEEEFTKTNVLIVSLAQAIARADRDTLIIVGRVLGCSDAELDAIECTAYESYADAALGDELEQVIVALTTQIGRQARIELLQRLVQKLLPGLASATRKTIDSEIEAEVDQAQKDKEAAAIALTEADNDNDDDETPPPADDKKPEDDEEEKAA